MTPAPPELVAALPKYRLTDELGRGSGGVVYAGWDSDLARRVAVKLLPARLAAVPEIRVRFREEGKALARLDHPHVVRVYDYTDAEVPADGPAQAGRVCALVLEHLSGGTLRERFTEYGLTMQQSCAATLSVLTGLQAAHDAGMLHRDIKAGNAMFDDSGSLKVTDFGLARIVGGEATLATRDGRPTVSGTLGYMSPEQARGERALDERTDIYSAAAVLYLLLTGRLPYSPQGGVGAYHARQTAGPPPHPGATVPAALADITMRGLAYHREQRPPSAGSFAEEIAARATVAFGAGWLDASGLRLRDMSPAVRKALTPAARSGPVLPVPGEDPVSVRPTVIVDVTPAPIRDSASLVPVEDLPPGPPSPRLPALVALIAAVLLVVLAFTWPARTAPRYEGPDLQVGTGGSTVRFDLSEAVEVSGRAARAATFRVRLSLSASGIPLGTSTSEPVTAAAGQAWRTTVPPTSLGRWLAGGAVQGRIETIVVTDRSDAGIRTGTGLALRELTVRPTQPPIASAMGFGGILAVLIAAAYLEGERRALEGRRHRTAPVIAVGWGLLLGAGLWTSVSALSRRSPTPAGGIVCVLLGAAMSAAALIAARCHTDADDAG